MIAYKYKLYRTKRTKLLKATLGEACHVWNHALALQKRYYKLFGKFASSTMMQKHFTKVWNRQFLGSQSLQEILQRQDKAYQRFFKHQSKRPPKFKRSNEFTSFAYKQCGYKFFDKDTQKWTKINRKNAKTIGIDAVAFYKPFPLRSLTVRDLFHYCISCFNVFDFIFAAALTAIATAMGMLLPYLNNKLFDEVVMTKDIHLLYAVATFIIAVSLSQLLISTSASMINSRISDRVDNAVEAASMMRIMSLRPDFFKNYGSGELGSYMGSLNSLCTMLITGLADTALGSIFSLAYIGSIFKYAKGLVVPALVVIAATLIFSVVSMYSQMAITKKTLKLDAKESNSSYAIITGVQKIKLSGAEKRAFAKWGKSYADMAALTYNPPWIIKINPVIATSITLIGTIVMYFFAITTSVSPADYYSFNIAYGMVSAAFSSLLSVALTLSRIKPVVENVKPILEAEPEVGENKEIVTSLSGAIELDNVTFRYSDDTPIVIDNMSLRIKKGQYLAIVGATGCGKSTLMRLLLGFEKPQRGTIYYDRKDINKLDVRSLRSRIGVVMQAGKLFMGDIFENIALSAPHINLDEAWEAAEIAGIADDIRAMPMGMSTMVTEGQGGISGGQRQRIMIARAVASKPSILMLDEATSALDNITQKHVSDALDKLKCTRIVIAHRLSTIKQADRIIVLDKGRIIEDGTYEELIALNGYFKELVARQME